MNEEPVVRYGAARREELNARALRLRKVTARALGMEDMSWNAFAIEAKLSASYLSDIRNGKRDWTVEVCDRMAEMAQESPAIWRGLAGLLPPDYPMPDIPDAAQEVLRRVQVKHGADFVVDLMLEVERLADVMRRPEPPPPESEE